MTTGTTRTRIKLACLSIFSPPASKPLHISTPPPDPPSIYTPPPDTFPLFPLLPFELQHQVWELVAQAWIAAYLERINTWTVSAAESESRNKKRVVLVHITSEKRYRRQHPRLLWTSQHARAVLYDALLDARGKGRVRRGEDVNLFLRGCSVGFMTLDTASVFGARVQDFRYEGLGKRMGEEEERRRIMRGELEMVGRGEVVYGDGGRGYVRLPGGNGRYCGSVDVVESGRRVVRVLYPAVGMETL